MIDGACIDVDGHIAPLTPSKLRRGVVAERASVLLHGRRNSLSSSRRVTIVHAVLELVQISADS